MTLSLIYLAAFVAKWGRLGLDDDDLRALEATIMAGPAAGRVMAGTGGLRKMRFAPPSWHTGRRGALRVCYAHFPDEGHVYLFTAYTHGEQDNLSRAERNHYRRVLTELAAYLKQKRPPPRGK